jgi:hypothetical protein
MQQFCVSEFLSESPTREDKTLSTSFRVKINICLEVEKKSVS